MIDDGTLTPDARQALRKLRLMWASFLAGPLVIAGVGVFMASNNPPTMNAGTIHTLLFVSLGLLVLLPVVGMFIRLQVYKRGWKGMVVQPLSYVQGNLILFAAIESVSLFAAVVLIVTRVIPQPLLIVVMATALLAMNFPSGTPMRPAPPELARK